MDKTKIEEIKVLCELEQSILNDGKIVPDESGFFESEKDKERVTGLSKLQDKYTYGWYIAKETMEEQIKSINDFKKYIMEHEKNLSVEV